MLYRKLFDHIEKMIPIVSTQFKNEEAALTIVPYFIYYTLYTLKNHIGFQFKILSCISGIDFLGKSYRFGLSYDLLSLCFFNRIRIKIFLNESSTVNSAINIYYNANWWEREVWDLFGIFFEGHSDLRRILTDYGFEGYPLRKDFPLYGFIELRYDEQIKRIIAEPVELSQDFRFFDSAMSI